MKLSDLLKFEEDLRLEKKTVVILRWIAMILSANFIMINFALRLTSSISPSLIFRFAFSLVKLWSTLGQLGVMDSTLFRSKSNLI